MDTIGIGKSELAGRTFGKEQKLERGAGLQVIGWFNEVWRRTHYRLTPNEGSRSRPDQLLVWNDYALYLAGRGPWAPRAAKPFTSPHDELTHPNAVDVGGPGGVVVPADVHAVMVAVGAEFGIDWTGRNFNEWWHFEVHRANARTQVPEGTTLITGSAPAAPEHQQEDDMPSVYIGQDAKNNIYVYDVGSRTKWNVIKGLSTVAQAMERIKIYGSRGIPNVGRVSGVEVAAFRDITNNGQNGSL